MPPARKRASPTRPAVAGVALTHPDRVLWEEPGLTKADLAAYHGAVAERLLPHVAGRPLTLTRCPGGLGARCFVARRPWAGLHASVLRARIGGDEGVAVGDLAGVIGLVQAGVLEIHPWGATLADPERPDRLVVDLDPAEGMGFPAVVAAALEVRARLDAAGLAAFAKTTGGKGLHVVAPLVPEAPWDAVHAFARALAEGLAADAPDRFTRDRRTMRPMPRRSARRRSGRRCGLWP